MTFKHQKWHLTLRSLIKHFWNLKHQNVAFLLLKLAFKMLKRGILNAKKRSI